MKKLAAKKRTDIYLIGYLQPGNCVYGRREYYTAAYVDPLTLTEAKEEIHWLSTMAPRAIFKLVPVKKYTK